MRVLVVIYEYPPVGGGGGKAAQEICRYLAGCGHQVQVITSHARGLGRHELDGDVNVWRVPCGRKQLYRADLASMARYVIAGFWKAWRMARRWPPDVIHVHFAVPSGPVAWALSFVTRIPYVLTAHLGDVPGGVPEKTAGWFRWIYPFTPGIWRSAARVVAVSEHTRQLALAHYPVDIQVIPNAIALANVKPAALRIGDPPRVVFAGRFQPQKNPLLVVQTLAKLRELPWTCAMLGDGPLRIDVEAEIARLGMGDRFDLPGWVDPEEVLAWFARSDLMFMPSRSEGLPVVGLQALASGLALVTSQVGGFVDLVADGENGYLLRPSDLAGFENAMRRLLQDRQLLQRFRKASLHRAGRFDIQTVGQAYETLFSEATIQRRDGSGAG